MPVKAPSQEMKEIFFFTRDATIKAKFYEKNRNDISFSCAYARQYTFTNLEGE